MANAAEQTGNESIDRTVWTATSTCRVCRAAWNMAPCIIAAGKDGKALFVRQPVGPEEEMQAGRAALACPTGSILSPRGLKMPEGIFPQEFAPNLYRLGNNDNATAGAHPFFIHSSTGLNFLIDGPRYVDKLVDFFEKPGGLDHVLLTHRDDVGASAKYAKHFGARLWIDENDHEASPEATDLLTSYDITEPISGATVIPIPGHTIGSVAVLIDEKLFVGDSLNWLIDEKRLWTNPLRCWDDWDMQRRSLKRLQDFRFDYVLAGHGGSIGLPAERMQAELASCLKALEDTTWQPLTHFPNGVPIPDEMKEFWQREVPRAKADFFAAMS